jgi:TolB-like protein
MADKLIAINLHGACMVRGLPPHAFEITGAKHKAMFALLATAPMGRRTRGFVQETLWGVADYEAGRQNLRRALADIKQVMGPAFAEVIEATGTELTLNLDRVALVGAPGLATFLEGIEVRTPAFLRWLEEMRRRPAAAVSVPAGTLSGAQPAKALEMLPAIAVIPFRAVSGSPEQAVLGDWLAEETSRGLSRSHLMAVISHLSSRRLAGASIDISDVSAKLGAAYCVTGGLRPDGDRIVLDADFVDCASGRLIWSRQCVLPAARPFEAGLNAVEGLVETVGRALTEESVLHVAGRALEDIEDHRLVVAGVGLMHRSALRDFARARSLLEEAASRAPHHAEIHAWLGKWYVLSVFNHWSADVAVDTQRSLDCTARALDLAPDSSFCLTMDGFAQNNLKKRLDIASQRYQLALQHNPSEALSWLLKGGLLAFQDKGTEAIEAAAKARRLSPIDPFGYFYDTLSASAHLSGGDYERALILSDQSIAANDRHLSTLRTRITALHFLGRQAEARETAALLMKRLPDFTVNGYRRTHPAADFDVGRRVASALTAAGVP